MTESQVRVGISVDIQPVRLIKLVTIVVRRKQSDHDEFVCGYVHLTDPDRNGRESSESRVAERLGSITDAVRVESFGGDC